MQKVEGSSPFSRFEEALHRGVFSSWIDAALGRHPRAGTTAGTTSDEARRFRVRSAARAYRHCRLQAEQQLFGLGPDAKMAANPRRAVPLRQAG